MRYSREHKQETHARIVRKASVRLREKGAHGIGVADLMKEAGLTHGGFYAHFDSRDALVIEAFAYAMDRSIEHWRKMTGETTPEKRLATIIDGYLSPTHRDDPGHGCAITSLGAEIARESPKTRRAFTVKVEQLIDLIACGGDQIHLSGQAFPRSNPSGHPCLFDVQPLPVSERLENSVSRITAANGSIEVEEHNCLGLFRQSGHAIAARTRCQVCIRSMISGVTAASPRATAMVSAVRGPLKGRSPSRSGRI